ncbi:MAG: hypothetical protein Q7S92_01125 [Candidatus Diapherotrites archaeon]|nr:hypothetical protein [Candidatus Diapherotrites archaeon]
MPIPKKPARSPKIKRSALSKKEKQRIKTKHKIQPEPYRTIDEPLIQKAVRAYTKLIQKAIDPEAARRAVKNQALKELANSLKINPFRKRRVLELITTIDLVEEIITGKTTEPELVKKALRELVQISREHNVKEHSDIGRLVHSLNGLMTQLEIEAHRTRKQAEYNAFFNVLKRAFQSSGKDILLTELQRILPERQQFLHLLVHQTALNRLLV